MIITEEKPFGLIKSKLKKGDKIGIISCNNCVRICGTGGKEKIKELAKKLEKEGFKVIDKDLIGMACEYDLLKKDELKGKVNIALCCDAGVYNLKKIFPNKRLISALDTIGLGAWDKKGNLTLVKKFGR